jgi:hypothetical protein
MQMHRILKVHNRKLFLISGYMNFREKMSPIQEAFEPLENIAVWSAIMQLSKHEGVHSV